MLWRNGAAIAAIWQFFLPHLFYCYCVYYIRFYDIWNSIASAEIWNKSNPMQKENPLFVSASVRYLSHCWLVYPRLRNLRAVIFHADTIFVVVDGGRLKIIRIKTPLQPMAHIPSQFVYGSCPKLCHAMAEWWSHARQLTALLIISFLLFLC